MLAKNALQEYSEILHWNDILSSMYLPLFVTYLYNNNRFLTVGHFNSLYYILVLALLEIVKYAFYISQNKTFAYKHNLKGYVTHFLVITLLFAVIYVITVLFGAPAFSNYQETCMFTLLVTTLTALPVCLYFGAENAVAMFLSLTLPAGNEIQKLFMLKVRLTFFGAWLGATVIPLDWNRPWQNWPIPCCMGVLLGHTLAIWWSTYFQYSLRSAARKKSGKYTL